MIKVWPANGHRAGENNPNHRLTWLDVIEIRSLAKDGVSCRAMAEKFGCDKTNILLIIKHKRWRSETCAR